MPLLSVTFKCQSLVSLSVSVSSVTHKFHSLVPLSGCGVTLCCTLLCHSRVTHKSHSLKATQVMGDNTREISRHFIERFCKAHLKCQASEHLQLVSKDKVFWKTGYSALTIWRRAGCSIDVVSEVRPISQCGGNRPIGGGGQGSGAAGDHCISPNCCWLYLFQLTNVFVKTASQIWVQGTDMRQGLCADSFLGPDLEIWQFNILETEIHNLGWLWWWFMLFCWFFVCLVCLLCVGEEGRDVGRLGQGEEIYCRLLGERRGTRRRRRGAKATIATDTHSSYQSINGGRVDLI